MRKIVLYLVTLTLLLGMTLSAHAAPGDAELFGKAMRELPEYEDLFIADAVWLDGAFYTQTYDDRVYRWVPGDELPTLFCTLPPRGPISSSYYVGEEPETKAALDTLVTQLAAGDGKLWAYNQYKGRVGEVTAQGVQWLDTVLDMKDMYDGEGCIKSISCPWVQDGKLYLVMQDMSAENDYAMDFALISFDCQTGARTKHGTFTDLQSLSPYQAGSVLALCGGYNQETHEPYTTLVRMDIATGAAQPLTMKIPAVPFNLGCLAYDATGDSIYFLADGQIYGSAGGGDFSVVGYLPLSYVPSNTRGFALPGNLYAMTEGALHVRNIDPQHKPQHVLRVKDYIDSLSIEAFMADHPDVPVLMSQGDGYAAALIVQNMSEATAITDIYCVNMESGARSLADKGYMASLADVPEFAANIDGVYPQIQGALRDAQGNPVAYPSEIGIRNWVVNTVLWSRFFGDAPLPTTFTELMAAYAQFGAEHADQEEYVFLQGFAQRQDVMRLVLDAYLRQYETADGPVDLTTPLLREVLAAVEELPLLAMDFNTMTEQDWDAVNRAINLPGIIQPYGDNILLTNPNYTSFDDSQTHPSLLQPMPWPVFEAGQEPVVPMGMTLAFVNPNSPSLDLAKELLTYMARPASNQFIHYALHPDVNDPLPYPYFEEQVTDMQKMVEEYTEQLKTAPPSDRQYLQESLDYYSRWLAEQDKNRWQITGESVAQYRALAPHLRVYDRSVYFGNDATSAEPVIYDLLDRYMAKQVDLDGMLKELNAKLSMIYLEGQ